MKLARIAVMASLLVVGVGLMVGTAPLRGAEIAPANSRQALAQTVSELNVDGVALSKVIDFLRNVSGTNLVVNWKSLEAAGVQRDAPITLTMRQVSLRKMLQLVLSQASPQAPLAYSIDSNVIEITTQEDLDKQMIIKVYIVDDLVMIGTSNVQAPRMGLSNMGVGYGGGYGAGGYGTGGYGTGGYGTGGYGTGGYGAGGYGAGGYGTGGYGTPGGGYGSGYGAMGGAGGGYATGPGYGNANQNVETSAQKGQELVDLIKAVIRPNIWTDNGGTATIRYLSGKLIVSAPVSVQEAIGGPVGKTAIRYGM
jgi:hypothetical protein